MAADVQIYQLRDGRWQYKSTNIYQLCQQREALTGCVILLLPAPLNVSTPDLQSLSRAFDIPTTTWNQQYQKATGFFLTDEARSSKGELTSYVTALRFLVKNITADRPKSPELNESIKYEWTHIGLWTQWRPDHSSILICSVQDYGGLNVWDGISRAFRNENNLPVISADQPFDWHSFISAHVTEAFDTAVWSCRDRIRYLEQNRPAKDGNTARPHYESMHEVARHSIHITETLAMSITVLENIIQEVQNINSIFKMDKSPAVKDGADHTKVLRTLRCQKTLLECSRGRAEALTARLQNEINLAFHLGAERDSAIATRMARSMRQDSTAMKTISVLGLVFLPGTFVSSIFGMSFFNFTPPKPSIWSMAEEFWIYWVVTVPLTLLTVVIWLWWFRRDLR